jgi:hypothetical protein
MNSPKVPPRLEAETNDISIAVVNGSLHDPDRTFVEPLGGFVIAAVFVDRRQIVEDLGDIGMIRAFGALEQAKSASEHGFRLPGLSFGIAGESRFAQSACPFYRAV